MGGTENFSNKNRLFVTVDIEDWYHIPSVCGSPFSVYKDTDEFFREWLGEYDYLTEPTLRVLKFLGKRNIQATFFVVADVVNHYPGLVEKISENGHEIACHGLEHACKIDPKTKKPLFTTEEFEKRTKEAKKLLENASGQKVIGYRAPNVLIAGWMLDSLEKIGFRYDSSICVNSFYNKSDSDLDGVGTIPYFPIEGGLVPGNKKRDIIEVPWAYLNTFGFRIPVSGGPMLRFLPSGLLKKGLIQSMKEGPAVMYFHPIDISNKSFPKIGKGRPFYWMIKGDVVEKRIVSLIDAFNKSGVNFCNLRDLMGIMI
ncbi:peptidoglycan/xylan/chitin deacetylase (PgdA/CDA1 family) [Methanomicrobium sp. W14]|uniref:polysaccharide deacetylase family protein n=1 Tax=Methanomicrobium sp. W14 TaxID=2817839 RepID=UPI001AE41A18|nr:polysaccharide deacetylase family protein [Methanomicrobium sp. W14]MBP2133115.1 peptidoglycan/xylan/chitin deacetylase (PgdA/CDA1 family) [Methanomicrobium sp. W14]